MLLGVEESHFIMVTVLIHQKYTPIFKIYSFSKITLTCIK